MDIEMIRTYVVTANSRTYNEAAEKLFITASTVSKHIQHIESECNIKLFERTPHGVNLTEAGKEALPHAEQILGQFNQIIAIADRIGNRTLRIATLPFHISFGFSELIREFIASYPDIKLIVEDCHGSKIVNRLLDSSYELAFSGLQYLDTTKIEFVRIKSNELVAVLPKNHPLAGKEQIMIEDLRDELFQILSPVSGVHKVIIDFCREHGFNPKLGYSATREDSILSLIEKGIGVSLLSKEYVAAFDKHTISAVPLAEKLHLDYGIVRLRNQRLSAPARILWKFIEDRFL